jgi:hypothetical protein
MPTIVQRVSNAGARGTRWRATPNAHRRKDQTVKISENKEERTRRGWLIFTALNWLGFIALQTSVAASHSPFSVSAANAFLHRVAVGTTFAIGNRVSVETRDHVLRHAILRII